MNVRHLALRLLQGLAGTLLFAGLVFLFVIWRLPLDSLVVTALPYAEAKSGLELNYDDVSSTPGGVVLSGFSVARDGLKWVRFKRLEAGLGVFSLLTGRPDIFLTGTLPHNGKVDIDTRLVFGTLNFSLVTRGLSLDPLNSVLSTWGAMVTSAADIDLSITLPLASPTRVTGEIGIQLKPVEIYGGAMAAGFGLEHVKIAKIRGKKEIRNGVIDKLDLLVDGDDLWGHLRLSLHLRKPFGASSYTFIPEIKFREDIGKKLIPVLPMAGLATNSRGFYTRTYRGTLSKL